MAKPASADVLLIEDSLEDAELTIFALRGTCTHITVDTFERSEDALSYLTRSGRYSDRAGHMPQLVVLDFDVPGVDARQALRQFKGDEELRAIPVIVLTTKRDPSLIKECYALGANSVLCKASQLKDYFTQLQQLAKYWLQVNATLPAQPDESDELQMSLQARSQVFDELRNH